MDQVRKYRPPENPAKLTDTRAEDYVRKFGNSSWELDALEPSVLAQLVKDAVNGLIDSAIWNEDLRRQQQGRDELKKFADTYGQTPFDNNNGLSLPWGVEYAEYNTREERPNDEY